MKTVLLLITFVTALLAADTGELSFYLMKDGKPLAGQETVIFKKAQQQTADVVGFSTR